MRKIVVVALLIMISCFAIATPNASAKLPPCKYDPCPEPTAQQLKEAAEASRVPGVVTGPLYRDDLEATIDAARVGGVITQPLLPEEPALDSGSK